MTRFDDEARTLYRAYSASYQTEAKVRNVKFFIDVAFAIVAALVVALRIAGNDGLFYRFLTEWMPFVSVCWLIARETGLFPDAGADRRAAVAIQQRFDLRCRLGDDWRQWWNELLLGDPPLDREVNALAATFTGTDVDDDYFVDTTNLVPNTAALLRVEQSAAWAALGHRRYASWNRRGASAAIAIVVLACAIASLDLRASAAVAMSMSSLVVGRLQSARLHEGLADRRCRLERYAQHLVDSVAAGPTDDETINALDELCRLRLVHRRIPNWLYQRHQAEDSVAVDGAVGAHAKRLRTSAAGSCGTTQRRRPND